MTQAQIIRQALFEDRVRHDVTTRLLVSSKKMIRAQIIFKQEGILCGVDVVREVFRQVDPSVQCRVLFKDGQRILKGRIVVEIKGSMSSILKAERTALNFLGYLSGIATRTAEYVRAVKPHKAKVLDTRKTTPLLRDLEKYAVRCGGGTNHRRDLSDMVLVKDNHIAGYGQKTSLAEMVRMMRSKTSKKIEVEVDDLNQFRDVVQACPDMILLDNMSPADMRKAVGIRNRTRGAQKVLLEASGGITLKNIRQAAAAGVDRISIGALTHSRQSIDVSLEFIHD